MRYLFAGSTITSNWTFDDLVPVTDQHSSGDQLCAVIFEAVDELGPFEATFELVHWDELIHSQRTDDAGTTLRFDDTAEFVVTPELDQLICRHTADADPALLRHTLLDQVLPRVVNAHGAFVLHASGVVTDHGAVLFLGESGAGKSTLAASFTSAGCTLIGDDCFVAGEIDGVFSTWPTYTGLRLLPASVDHLYGGPQAVDTRPMASASPKVRVVDQIADRDQGMRPQPIAAIFVIDNDAEDNTNVRTSKLDPRSALMELIRNSFRLDIQGREAVAQSLDQAAALAMAVPMYSVTYPRVFEALTDVHQSVLLLVGE